MKLYAGYEDAVDQFLEDRAGGWATARILEALSQASEEVFSSFRSIYSIESILTASTWTLDFTASMPADEETLDLRGQTYTFVSGTPAASGEIKIQGNATDMAEATEMAIEGQYHPDVYSNTPMDPYCSGAATAGVLVLTSRKVGRATSRYAITDWNGSRVNTTTDGTGHVPLFRGWALDLFGGYLFAGGGTEVQGRQKAASQRMDYARQSMEPYQTGAQRLYYLDADGERVAVPWAGRTAGYSTHDPTRSYAERQADRGDTWYEELRARKHGDL